MASRTALPRAVNEKRFFHCKCLHLLSLVALLAQQQCVPSVCVEAPLFLEERVHIGLKVLNSFQEFNLMLLCVLYTEEGKYTTCCDDYNIVCNDSSATNSLAPSIIL